MLNCMTKQEVLNTMLSLQERADYLNIPFFTIVALLFYALIWIGFTMASEKHSLAEDQDGNIEHYKRSVVLSAIFIVFFA